MPVRFSESRGMHGGLVSGRGVMMDVQETSLVPLTTKVCVRKQNIRGERFIV